MPYFGHSFTRHETIEEIKRRSFFVYWRRDGHCVVRGMSIVKTISYSYLLLGNFLILFHQLNYLRKYSLSLCSTY